MADEAEERRERLKEALWFAIAKTVDQESLRWNRNATPQFIGALTAMIWTQIENVAQDLESFSSHAGRSTVNTSDVLLLTRRNPELHSIIKALVDEQQAARPEKGKKRR